MLDDRQTFLMALIICSMQRWASHVLSFYTMVRTVCIEKKAHKSRLRWSYSHKPTLIVCTSFARDFWQCVIGKDSPASM